MSKLICEKNQYRQFAEMISDNRDQIEDKWKELTEMMDEMEPGLRSRGRLLSVINKLDDAIGMMKRTSI